MFSLVYDPISTELLIRKNNKFIVFSNGATFSNLVLSDEVNLTSGLMVVNASIVVSEDSTIIISGDAIVEII